MKLFKKLDKGIIFIIIILLIISGNVMYFTYVLYKDNLTKKINAKEQINTLFLFVNGRDLMFAQLFLYNPATKKGGIFFIPDNLGVRIAQLEKFDKISVLYRPGNTKAIAAKVTEVLGIKIDFIIDISLDNVVKLIDLLGGIEFFINSPLQGKYNEEIISIPAGSVVLDGEKTRDYLLFEQEDDDEETRATRKNNFTKALLAKINQPEINEFLLRDDTLRLLGGFLKINLSGRSLKSFIAEMNFLHTDLVAFQRVQGSSKQIEGIAGEMIFPFFKGELIKASVTNLSKYIADTETSLADSSKAKIEIMNGTDREGLAGKTKLLLESYGYHVVSIGNAENNNYEKTILLDRRGNFDTVQEVAQLIHCTKEMIQSEIIVESNVDITIILGKDFDEQYVR